MIFYLTYSKLQFVITRELHRSYARKFGNICLDFTNGICHVMKSNNIKRKKS